jgi:2-dehydropantoate 2-reductase
MLARTGHAVTLVARPQHVKAIRDHGLILETAAFTESLAVTATTDASGESDAELVLFCVKSGDTVAAGHEMAPHLEAGAAILSLQNGVDNAERLQQVLGRPSMPRPRCPGRGMSGIMAAASSSSAQGRRARRSPRCSGWGLAVARACGVRIEDGLLAKVLGLAATMPDQLSSTARDLARGKPTEIDHLNGCIVRAGERLGVATPANRLLTVVVKLMEASTSD